MTGMWVRWARRRRLVGLAYLAGAAVAVAVAVLLFFTGDAFGGFLVGLSIGVALALTVSAGFEFADAHKYARLAG